MEEERRERGALYGSTTLKRGLQQDRDNETKFTETVLFLGIPRFRKKKS